MGELRAVQLRTGPFHAGICGAFTEIDVVFARKAFKISVGKHQRRIHQPVDHQAVIFFAQLNRAGMVTLKRAALRRDRPVQCMDRRKVDGADRVCGQPFNVAAHNVVFEPDRQAIWRFVDAIAKGLRPWLYFGDQWIGRCSVCRACRQRTCTCSRRTAQKRATGRAVSCFIS